MWLLDHPREQDWTRHPAGTMRKGTWEPGTQDVQSLALPREVNGANGGPRRRDRALRKVWTLGPLTQLQTNNKVHQHQHSPLTVGFWALWYT